MCRAQFKALLPLLQINKLILGISLLLNVIEYGLLAAPDPMTLLKGVESAREQIPPSRLLMRKYVQTTIVTNDYYYLVLFDREKRYFKRTNNLPVHTMFNGSEVIISQQMNNYGYLVEIRNLDMRTADSLFDPRILGIDASLGWTDTIQSCLLINQDVKVELIGKEQIDNKDVWHIRITSESHSVIRDLWIDDKNNFRVYQCKDCFSNGTNLECNISKSYYESEEYPWLPSRVETETYNGRKRTLKILKAEANVKIPESQWTIYGMDLPKGVSIIDLRNNKIIGHWDGKKFIREREGEDPKPIPKVSFGKPAILIILILLSVIPLTIVVVRNLRKKE